LQIRTKEFEIAEIRVEQGVDLGFGIKDCFAFQFGVIGKNSFNVQCCVSGRHH
jgi:hypothetical protein